MKGTIFNLKRGCLFVIIFEVAIIILAVAGVVLFAVDSYDGSCIRWDGAYPGETCTAGEYTTQVLASMLLYIVAWWPATLLVLIVIAGVAFLLVRGKYQTG
jgi:hypothetical protein